MNSQQLQPATSAPSVGGQRGDKEGVPEANRDSAADGIDDGDDDGDADGDGTAAGVGVDVAYMDLDRDGDVDELGDGDRDGETDLDTVAVTRQSNCTSPGPQSTATSSDAGSGGIGAMKWFPCRYSFLVQQPPAAGMRGCNGSTTAHGDAPQRSQLSKVGDCCTRPGTCRQDRDTEQSHISAHRHVLQKASHIREFRQLRDLSRHLA